MSELETIKAECEKCERCSLCRTRKNLVFGVGNEHASLLFIGEAPGEQEDLSGVPFVGAAGKLFDKYLCAVGIERDSVYIANILKCRPPHNRDPEPAEEDACIGWLKRQIEAISPDVIVCLGRISAMRLISPDFRITRDHGKWYKFGNTDICAVYHPSALLRDESKRGDMLADMINIKKKLGEKL
ncbi:MAG: uracil-DNA glycosylase [Clostridiales bacterium]|nr:uracil-DNA glycosylase [Clostridiales bacterium]